MPEVSRAFDWQLSARASELSNWLYNVWCMSESDDGLTPPQVPLPVQPLAYSLPWRQRRPGIITAIGVVTIVVACLSGLASLLGGMYGLMFYTISKMSTRMSASTVVTSASPNPPGTPTLTLGDATVAVNVLKGQLSLDASHVRELNRLMRKHGREILGGDEDTPLTAAEVKGDIISSKPQPDDPASAAEFTTASGKVSIFADHAVFTSNDGTQTVRTSAADNSDSQTQSSVQVFPSTAASSSSTALTPAQVSAILTSVQSMANPRLNAAQVSALQMELSKPSQSLTSPGVTPAVSSVFVQPGGNANIIFATGNQLLLGPNGQVIVSGAFMPRFGISGRSMGMVVGEATGSVALAIYLLVVGILVFRPQTKAPRLLRIYALLKIPLALLAGAGAALMSYEFATGISTMGGVIATAPPNRAGFVLWGTVVAVVGLAYPIAVLIVLRTKTVREYYGAAPVM